MHYVESLRATTEPTSKKVQYKIPKAEFYTSISIPPENVRKTLQMLTL